jgi:hypothetical protein
VPCDPEKIYFSFVSQLSAVLRWHQKKELQTWKVEADGCAAAYPEGVDRDQNRKTIECPQEEFIM